MSEAHDRKRSAAKPARGADSPAEGVADRRVCMPCHGTGKVISNLGGHARKVTCPWCHGGGVRLTGVDAQEWRQEQARLARR